MSEVETCRVAVLVPGSEFVSQGMLSLASVLDIRSDFEQPLESVVRPYWGITFHPHSNIVPIGKLQCLGQTIRYVVMRRNSFRNNELLLNIVAGSVVLEKPVPRSWQSASLKPSSRRYIIVTIYD